MKTYKYIQNNFFLSSRLTGEHHNDFEKTRKKNIGSISQQIIVFFIEFLGCTLDYITLINALVLTSLQILKRTLRLILHIKSY